MLLNLHVKNLAIIDEIEVDFSEGMNVLTGETGAGKSIIIGSVDIAIGGKVPKDIIRKGSEYALVELAFSVDTPEQHEYLEQLGLTIEDDEILVSRKITKGRTINRINGQSVPASALREAAAILIDVHGQNEQQSLLYKAKHMEIVDRYAKDKMAGAYEEYSKCYTKYRELISMRDNENVSEEERLREISFMQYELEEIENAAVVHGEEDNLSEEYRVLANASSIALGLGEIYSMTGSSQSQSVSEYLSQSIRIFSRISDYDKNVAQLAEQLSQIDSLVYDFNRDMLSYMDGIEVEGDRLDKVEKRLDLVRKIKSKYGATTADVNAYADKLRAKLKKYEEYEEYKENLEGEIEECTEKLTKLAGKMTKVRTECSKILKEKITDALIDLNFLQVQFEIENRQLSEFSPKGLDEIEFMISTNPGEDLKPIGQAASGGELSRIMLAVKAVLAEHDEISTLIFDEIDSGISGRTAQKVAEKMSIIARSHQVICISHLAQIAAMTDAHYLIEKTNDGQRTSTIIRKIEGEDSVSELARILGGAEITDSVINSAKEMKKLADDLKKA